MNYTEVKEELLNRINSLIELMNTIQMQKDGNSSLFTHNFNQTFQLHLGNSISLIEKQIKYYKKKLVEIENNQRLIQLREENRRNEEAKRARIKAAIAAHLDYSNKSDEQLKKEYSYIRAQIRRIAKKIWDLCEGKEIPTFYHYNDFGEIELKKAEGVSVSEMIFEMNEIISNLEANLSAIEDNYRGMDLKEIPVLEIPDDELNSYQEEEPLEIEEMLRDNPDEEDLDNYSLRIRN